MLSYTVLLSASIILGYFSESNFDVPFSIERIAWFNDGNYVQ